MSARLAPGSKLAIRLLTATYQIGISPLRDALAQLSGDGLVILDLRVPAGADWVALAERVDGLAGVVDHGLFRVPLAQVLVGSPDGGCAPAG